MADINTCRSTHSAQFDDPCQENCDNQQPRPPQSQVTDSQSAQSLSGVDVVQLANMLVQDLKKNLDQDISSLELNLLTAITKGKLEDKTGSTEYLNQFEQHPEVLPYCCNFKDKLLYIYQTMTVGGQDNLKSELITGCAGGLSHLAITVRALYCGLSIQRGHHERNIVDQLPYEIDSFKSIIEDFNKILVNRKTFDLKLSEFLKIMTGHASHIETLLQRPFSPDSDSSTSLPATREIDA